MTRLRLLLILALSAMAAQDAVAQIGLDNLSSLSPGHSAAKNALWRENPLSARFHGSKRVVIAQLEGPATITMIHFAMPATLKLNRDVLLKAYWDGEKEPSVDCPLVDFFCDPAGMREEVNTALVNKRRGWNAYFPMPFRKSARLELVYDGPLSPGDELWRQMPCYSYVMYRTLESMPETEGYFHAHWRQEDLLLGRREYTALEAKGNGKFVGWNVTVRCPGRSDYLPVDENEKFFIDGEQKPSVEFQGLEDSFGFSWSFPATPSQFPWTGYFPFFKGAGMYRFFVADAIRFEKSLRVTIGFGEHEDPRFAKEARKPASRLQFSSTVYWYQVEPHAALPAMPPPARRAPAPDDPSWWKTHFAEAANPASQPASRGSLRLTLPPVCYAVVGVPMSIYYDNLVLTQKPEQYRFTFDGDLGTAEARRWTMTPKAADMGDHPLSVSVSDSDGKRLQTGKIVVHVSPADAGAGRSIRLLLVGDSLTHASIYPNEISRLLSQPGNPTWTMLGTHRPAAVAKGVAHEGYGGWTWERFETYYVAAKPGQSYKERGSPFVFAAAGGKPALDLARYFEASCGGQRPDFVTFLLGVNDCFYVNPEDATAVDARIDWMFGHADKLIAAFRKAAPKAQLGICLCPPPNSRESGFQANYAGKYHRLGWKRIQHRLVQRELEHFGGRQSERIFIVPTELNLDPVDGYPVGDGVHPNAFGYQQIGDSIFAWMKSRL
jgi:lysophospholipase L1-like esterase